MQKIIRIDNKVIVILDSGNTLQRDDITNDEFNLLINAVCEDDIIRIMCPNTQRIIEARNILLEAIEEVHKSSILTYKNNCIYWEEVSPLSLPKDLADGILKAEEENDTLKLETYKNFWTLMSLNTDEDCRQNLYAFLRRHDFKLSRCGFFVAYRNADTTSEEGVYTDHHSHTFKIKIGEMVTMPRKQCDCDSANECSKGLHVAGANWLDKNYFGNMGLVCLLNPADVVAVPERSTYGKLRCCAYLPIDIINYNTEGKVIPYPKDMGFDCEYVPKVIYEGLMGTEQDSPYKLHIPEIPGMAKESIADKLLDIARKAIVNRVVHE